MRYNDSQHKNTSWTRDILRMYEPTREYIEHLVFARFSFFFFRLNIYFLACQFGMPLENREEENARIVDPDGILLDICPKITNNLSCCYCFPGH
jgi:hypothetical protein